MTLQLHVQRSAHQRDYAQCEYIYMHNIYIFIYVFIDPLSQYQQPTNLPPTPHVRTPVGAWPPALPSEQHARAFACTDTPASIHLTYLDARAALPEWDTSRLGRCDKRTCQAAASLLRGRQIQWYVCSIYQSLFYPCCFSISYTHGMRVSRSDEGRRAHFYTACRETDQSSLLRGAHCVFKQAYDAGVPFQRRRRRSATSARAPAAATRAPPLRRDRRMGEL